MRASFNSGWAVQAPSSPFATLEGKGAPAEDVRLPHDALIGQPRSAGSPQGVTSGYFPDGAVEYTKDFDVPFEYEQRCVRLVFEGVYRDAVIYVNDEFAGQRPSGYAEFSLDVGPFLRFGGSNRVRVVARVHQDSRWYTGLGIHRPVWLVVTDRVHLADNGVTIRTLDAEGESATVEIATVVENHSVRTRTATVMSQIIASDGRTCVQTASPLTLLPGERGVTRHRVVIEKVALWSPDRPHLYSVQTALTVGARTVETQSTTFGARTLQLDAQNGLRINGEVVTLRGACVHHDNGPLGAATFGRADERRVEGLRAAGFNALRSAHNPMSRAMLDACDRLGMLVMDEAFDMWTVAKSNHDYALAFPEWWERDIEAMVAKDINHPSVIMYSIGNEIPETGSPIGSGWGRRIAEKIRGLDPDRYVTNSVNLMLSVLPEVKDIISEQLPGRQDADFNTLLSNAVELLSTIAPSPQVTIATEESFAAVDIAGINYGESRYGLDRELFPHRVIVGSETFPSNIDVNWSLVSQHSHVIGDFTWTGWDYLGEAGVGRVDYADDGGQPTGVIGPFPWLTSWTGDIDITGHRRSQSYYREIVFGRRHEPYIAVQRPQRHGLVAHMTPWSWEDTISSWTWDVDDGVPVVVHVYSDAEEVELICNGVSVGRAPTGDGHRFRAAFETTYQRGELIAVARTDGSEVGRAVLRSASGGLHIRASVDRDHLLNNDDDLAFVSIELVDSVGVIRTDLDRTVAVDVAGAGRLQALGSADPRTLENFTASRFRTFDGRALAVIRPQLPGTVQVRISADGCKDANLEISVSTPEQDG